MRSYFGYYNWCEEFTLAENPPPGMGGHIDGRGLEPEATYIDQSGLIYGIYGEYQYSVASTVPFQIKFWQRNPPLIKQHLSRASLSNDGRFALYQSQWLSEEALPDTVNNVGSEFVSLQLLNPIGPCDAP
jgi:hypothetical protein